MALDLSRPRGDRVLVPGVNINAKPGPLCSDVVYFMDGKPNVFEVWATVSGLLHRYGYMSIARVYRDTALADSMSYDDVVEYSEQFVTIVRTP